MNLNDLVLCVDNNNNEDCLTKGGIYRIVETTSGYYEISNNFNNIIALRKSRFLKLTDIIKEV